MSRIRIVIDQMSEDSMVGELNSTVPVTSNIDRCQHHIIDIRQQAIYTDYHKTIITDHVYRLTQVLKSG